MKTGKFYGTVKEGKLVLDYPERASEFISTFEENTPIEIEIKKQYNEKSQNQLGYFFGCLIRRCAEVSGYTETEVDGIFCKAALTQNKGTIKEYVKSKALCSTVELNHLIDIGRNLAASMWGIIIEEPDKNWKNK